MTSEIRFTTSADGTRIAYTTFGSGPDLIELPRWAVTIEWKDRDDEYRRFYEKLAEFRRVTIIERRGTGAGQREVDDVSTERHVDDVRAVADNSGIADFDMLGSGDSVAVCIQAAADMPDRVRSLVLWAGYAKGFGLPQDEPERFRAEAFRRDFPSISRLTADDFFPNHPPAHARRIAQMWVDSMSPEMAYRYLEWCRSMDVTPALPDVRVPTTVMYRRGDQTGHLIEYSEQIAAGIPGSRFVIVDGDVGVPQYEHDDVIAEMRKFLGAESREASAPGGATALRTVLFTDLVGHTEMMQRLGDDRGRDVLREHERITREVLKANGGTEVKTMGDGFMASFGSVTKAVECAVALQRAFDEWNRGVGVEQLANVHLNSEGSPRVAQPLRVRVGLNAGEPIEEDGDLFGATVILASRIAAKAEGGEILVADTVRGLCSGKGFLFADRGEFVAKGIEEPVRVYEVRWHD